MFRWISELLRGKPQAAAEPDVDILLSGIEGAWQVGDELPRPNWLVIRRAIEVLPDSTLREAAWNEVQRQWLDELCNALGEPYLWVDSGSVLMLTAREPSDAQPFARLAQSALAVVDEVLGEPATPLEGKLAVLAFESSETYYSYIAHFYEDGEHGTSGGCFLTEDGHVQVAVIDVGYDVERTITHEMVHVRLRGRELPLWIEEGIAEVVSRRATRSQPLLLEREDVVRQLHWWRKRGLESFWSGASFSANNRGQQLSYTLAEVIVQTLVADRRGQFSSFLAHADRADGGDAAARKSFGISISDLAGRFLGDGDWAYRPHSHDPSSVEKTD